MTSRPLDDNTGMASLLNAVELRVRPDYNMFGITDSAAIDFPDPPLPIVIGHWISAGPAKVLIESPQRSFPVTLRLESWDRRPADPDGEWEIDETFHLDLPSGWISLNAMSDGSRLDALELPFSGPYTLRVLGRHREQVARAGQELFVTYDIDDPAFVAGWQALEGKEYYLARLWPYGAFDKRATEETAEVQATPAGRVGARPAVLAATPHRQGPQLLAGERLAAQRGALRAEVHPVHPRRSASAGWR